MVIRETFGGVWVQRSLSGAENTHMTEPDRIVCVCVCVCDHFYGVLVCAAESEER